MVAAAKTKTTKNNSLMAYVTLEDDTGSLELLVFSRVLEESGSYLQVNLPILTEGRISVRDEKAPQLMWDLYMHNSQTGPFMISHIMQCRFTEQCHRQPAIITYNRYFQRQTGAGRNAD